MRFAGYLCTVLCTIIILGCSATEEGGFLEKPMSLLG